jgi:kynurenine formamidase
VALSPELQALAARVSNWGRWGADDERGTLNLIDVPAVQRGTACARRGAVFSLAIPFDDNGPQLGTIEGRTNPHVTRPMVNTSQTGDPSDATWSDDRFEMGVQAATHWDTLAHLSYDGLLYNGVPNSVVTIEDGATRLGVEAVGPVVSRGVVLDVARALGHDPALPPAYEITADDLDRALAATGLTLVAGDVALVRTGQMHVWRDGHARRYSMMTPGLGETTIEWFHRHDAAAVAIDTLPFEPINYKTSDWKFPVQMIMLRDMGLLLGQLWDLDVLAADCAADGRSDVLLVANPLPLTHGIGGVCAPVAIK